MPKINVYLPDDLAETVKELNIPVSAICQRALEGSVKRIALIRTLTVDDLRGEKAEQLTQRALDAIRLAAEAAGDTKITTAHLLHGIVSEGANLALDVLRAIDIEPPVLTARLAPFESPLGTGFASDAANALELAVVESIALGHNYVGCEHLLLGLVAEPDGQAGELLRGFGTDLKSTRRAVQTALAGIVHLKKQQQATPDAARVLQMIMARLDRLEKQVGIG
jgi:ATP-dependent Clp protease ATP-binding subunit ClpA